VNVVPRLCVDFDDLDDEIGLSYYGTFRDLCITQTVLRPGLAVTLYDDSDGDEAMEVDAVVLADNVDAASPMHRWKAKVTSTAVRRIPITPRGDIMEVPCFNCRKNIAAELTEFWRGESTCSHCKTPILVAYLGGTDV
jgi:hypothetical protein